EIRAHAADLVERHSYELCLVLPALRREIEIRNPCLTDVASGDEKVRNYPNDRAYRSLHGIVELLAEWQARAPQGGWPLAIDAFDASTPLVWSFYAELLRRRGAQLGLSLLLAVEPEAQADFSLRKFFEQPGCARRSRSISGVSPTPCL